MISMMCIICLYCLTLVNSIKVVFLLIYGCYPHYVMYMHCFGVITYKCVINSRITIFFFDLWFKN